MSPGALQPAHEALATRCFTCHAPLRGALAERCIGCHPVADIGVRLTTGAPAPVRSERAINTSFHEQLSEQGCVTCHGEHSRKARRAFSHALLREELRERCAGCHAPPADALHRQLTGGCAQCHSPSGWRPSTFDHTRLFALDGDHDAACATCHPGNDFKRYTCFGCHEHTPANIREEHEEEGVRDFDDCVACHRRGEGDGEGRRGEDR